MPGEAMLKSTGGEEEEGVGRGWRKRPCQVRARAADLRYSRGAGARRSAFK